MSSFLGPLSTASPFAEWRCAPLLVALWLVGLLPACASSKSAGMAPSAPMRDSAVAERYDMSPPAPPPPPGARPRAGKAAADSESRRRPKPRFKAGTSTRPAGGIAGSKAARPTPTPSSGNRPGGAVQAKQVDPDASKQVPAIAQMLIYEAQLRLQVDRQTFASNIDRTIDLAVSLGGYVSRHDNNTVQVRVPSTAFREAVKAIEKLGKVTHRSVTAQDVSEEYHDLATRLQSARATRNRLEQFLKRAKNIAEVLTLEKELARINGEIDRIEGRMRYLASRASYSTITVTFQPKPDKRIVVDTNDHPPLPTPPPQTLTLPIDWLSLVGLGRLMDLKR